MLTDHVREALRQVVDPEMGINIVDLGLVYAIDAADGATRITLTMTTPACPLGEYLKDSATAAVRALVPDAGPVEVALVLDPPWSPARMTAEARRQLGWPADR